MTVAVELGVFDGPRLAMHEERHDAMCRRHPTLSATIMDLPHPAAVGRQIVAEHGFSERVGFREGDVFEIGLGDALDVVSSFNLIHHLPESRCRELCRMARAALRPGGCLAIAIRSVRFRMRRSRPERSRACSSMRGATGHNFASREVGGWLEEAGFTDVEVTRNERSPWPIVVTGRA